VGDESRWLGFISDTVGGGGGWVVCDELNVDLGG